MVNWIGSSSGSGVGGGVSALGSDFHHELDRPGWNRWRLGLVFSFLLESRVSSLESSTKSSSNQNPIDIQLTLTPASIPKGGGGILKRSSDKTWMVTWRR